MVASRAMTFLTPTEQPPEGFFGRVFDVRFRGFAAPWFVQVLYSVGMVLILLGFLIFVASGFTVGQDVGLVFLFVIGPFVSVFLLALLRLLLEFYLTVSQLVDDLREWREEWDHRR